LLAAVMPLALWFALLSAPRLSTRTNPSNRSFPQGQAERPMPVRPKEAQMGSRSGWSATVRSQILRGYQGVVGLVGWPKEALLACLDHPLPLSGCLPRMRAA